MEEQLDWVEELLTPKIIYNAIKCPDGVVIESEHRYDYTEHTTPDGRTYAVDGGGEYQRILACDDDYENLIVYITDDHSKVREVFKWGSYGENGDKPLIRLPIAKLSDAHIYNLVDFTEEDYPFYIHKLFITELNYRIKNNINVGEYDYYE